MRMMRKAVEVTLVAALLCGCSDDEVLPGVEAIYAASETTDLTPYPSNRYTVPADTATGLSLAISASNTADYILDPGLSVTVDELNEMNGFSPTGGVIVAFDGPIDVTGIALPPDFDAFTDEPPPLLDASAYQQPDAPFMLIDVDPDSEHRGEAIGLVPRWWEQPKDDYYIADEYTLLAQPAVPLRPGTRYLFAILDGLKARSGGEVTRSALTEELIAGRLSDDYAAEVDAGLEVLAEAGVSRDRVKLVTTFTTATVQDGTLAAARIARESAAPAILEPWEIETAENAEGRVQYRVVFEAPEYRKPLPDGRWELDDDGDPIPQEMVGLEAFMGVSDAQSAEPRTVVIYGHGLGGDKGGTWGTAGRLASLNAAVFSIDSPHHGSRGDGADNDFTPIARFFGVDFTENTFVIGKARDNFRQMAIDQLNLVRFIQSLDTLDILPPGAPDGIPDLDTTRIVYIGHSFGSVQGASIFALAPEIGHAVWNVGGASLMMLLRDSNLFGILVDGLRPDGYSDGSVARFMAIAQAIVDPGDPINYARHAQLEPTPGVSGWAARDVLIQEVIDDTIVPNTTSRALARAAGLQLLDPLEPVTGLQAVDGPVTANLPSGATGAMSQFDVADGMTASHGELIFAAEGLAQYLEFLTTGLADGHGTIPPSYP